jgi:poly(3-hydroxyalkanoate) synthetase
MLGEAPPAFDLLYWNGDGTNLPAQMAVEYLRGLCQQDGFAKGDFKVFGKPVSLPTSRSRSAPSPARPTTSPIGRGSFNGIKQMGSKDKTFILSESGHIAGSSTRRPRTSTATTPTPPPWPASPRPGSRPRPSQGQLVAPLGRLAGRNGPAR